MDNKKTKQKIGGTALLVIIFLITLSVIIPAISVLSRYGIFEDVFSTLPLGEKVEDSFTVPIAYTNDLNFSYSLSEIIIDSHGARLVDGGSSTILLQSPLTLPQDAFVTRFEENSVKPEGTKILYQLSSNYTDWYYHNGVEWTQAGTCEDCFNSIEEINSHLATFPEFNGSLNLKVYMETENGYSPLLQSLNLTVEGKQETLSENQQDWLDSLLVYACYTSCHPDPEEIHLVDDSASTCDETPLAIDVLANDSGPINPSELSISSNPQNGVAEISSQPGIVVYTPNEGYVGSDSFKYEVCTYEQEDEPDECGECDGKVTRLTMRYLGSEEALVRVEQRREGPIFEQLVGPGDTFSIEGIDKKDTLGTEIYFFINDEENAQFHTSCSEEIGPGSKEGLFEVVSGESRNGGVLCPVPGYTPPGAEPTVVCEEADVNITINQCTENIPPIALDDEGEVCRGEVLTLNVLDNDSDPDGTLDYNTLEVTSGPSAGEIISVNKSTGEISFVSAVQLGEITFTYEICDNEGACVPSLVTINVVQCEPEGEIELNDESTTVCMNTPLTYDVLSNDTTSDPFDYETFEIFNGPGNGDAGINQDNHIYYTPDLNFQGNDLIEYEICNEIGLCDSATFTIEVIQCDDTPPDVEFDLDDTALCEYDPKTLTVEGTAIMPEGEEGRLQLSWRIVYPEDLQTDTAYINYGNLMDEDRFSFDVNWPGIRPSDTVVEIHIGAMLLDPQTGNPIMDNGASLDYYWYPWVCPPPPEEPEPDFSIFVNCVKDNEDGTFTANFGYENRLDIDQELDRSDLHPDDGAVIGTPPYTLLSGRHDHAFTVTAPNGSNIVWTAKADDVTKTSTAADDYPVECPVSCYAASVVSYSPGLRKDNLPVLPERSDPTKALGIPQNNDSLNFVSLGFGGELVLGFDQIIQNIDGDDISVVETSFGSPSCSSYPETIRMYVSPDGSNWTDLGTGCLDSNFELGSVADARYVRLVDITDRNAFSGGSTVDGFDVDGVMSLSCDEPPPPPEETTIIAHKIVCEDESDLPNWGAGGPDITASTAIDYVNSHPGCRFEAGWNFQWGFSNVSNPGDNSGEATGDWVTFGPSDGSGMAQTVISELGGNDVIKMREVWNDDYIEFTGQNTTNNVSAEFYCHTDVLHYDNDDWIRFAEEGNTYYCVAFNVEKEPPVQTGSINVCKVILDQGGNIVDGSELTSSTLSIDWLTPPPGYSGPGALATSVFDVPLTYTADLIYNDDVNDAQCILYDNLTLGGYYYDQELIDSPYLWESPLYNDQYQSTVNTLEDFFEYSGEIFTPDPGDDSNRNQNADGHITLSQSRPNRTLVVLNQYQSAFLCGNGIVEGEEQCDDGNTVDGDGCSSECTLEDKEVTLVATKIICDSEQDLPNWGRPGGPNITATTATDFVASNPNCRFQENWEFQWGDQNSIDPDDNVLYAGGTWTTFGPTNASGQATTIISYPPQLNKIWVREVRSADYVPFSGDNGGDVSAEFYCHTDVFKYDNRDGIDNPQDNETYYCVGFNALLEPEPFCGNEIIEDGEMCDDGNNIDGDGCSAICQIEPATVTMHKIVCDSEDYLPNWGYGAADITASTASDFVAENPACEFVSGWNFQWGDLGAENPGDNTGVASEASGWNTLPATDGDGMTQVSFENLSGTFDYKFREVWEDSYIEFDPQSDESAEFYCGTDVMDFDNYESLSIEAGGEYNCVGFNVEEPVLVPDYSLVAECIDLNENETYTAHFGYINRADFVQALDTSYLSPSDGSVVGTPPQSLFMGQYDDVFTATGPITSDITWTTSVNGEMVSVAATPDDEFCTEPPPEDEPPVVEPEAFLLCVNESGTYDVVANDSDPEDALDLESLVILASPNDGTIDFVNTDNGNITYTPDADFVGTDAFTYELCDTAGQCDSASTVIQVGDFDFCGTETEVLGDFGINPELCNGRVYSNVNLSFSGYNEIPVDQIAEMEYTLQRSISTNTAWRGININPVNPGTFNFNSFNLDSGDYNLTVRVTYTDGSEGFSPICEFTVDPVEADPGCLIFGANQFILSSQASPISTNGVISFVEDEPQTFYLEAQCASEASVVNMDTADVYPLEYNEGLKLWTGGLIFDDPGEYRLQGFVGSRNSGYTREINTVRVTTKSRIIDALNGGPIVDALISVYERDVDSGEYILWNGESYGRTNPFSPGVTGEFSLILPKGQFYLEVSRPGYESVTSRIVTLEDHSVVSANVQMIPVGTLAERFLRLVSRSESTNNFALSVTPLPSPEILQLGEVVPDVGAEDEFGNKVDLFEIYNGKPAVMMVYSAWNTLSEEQLDHFVDLAGEYTDIDFIPISTMEPANLIYTYIERGRYDINLYKPDNSFFDDYKIISLPEFFLLDEEHRLQQIVVGPKSYEELRNIVESNYR